MKFRYLSHPLTDRIPCYGKIGHPGLKNKKSITRDGGANVFSFSMENHWGTHVDLPNHFFKSGKRVSDYEADFWFFKSPQVIGVHSRPSEILKCGDWLDRINKDSDMLLLKAGWTALRGSKRYSFNNPGIHSEVALYLRKYRKNIRAVGIDWVSISAYRKRDIGREAHKAFLDPRGKNDPVVIIEDMDLSHSLGKLKEVIVSPLRIERADSAPCTIIGIFYD